MTTFTVANNDYDQSFNLPCGAEAQIFDRFECAFYAVAPQCAYCGSRVAGRGIEARGIFFCGGRCAYEYNNAGQLRLQLSEATG